MHFRKYIIFAICCLSSLFTYNTNAQKIDNIILTIKGKTIILTYELIAENPNAICDVKVYFGNSSFQNEMLTNGEGDYGANVFVGKKKKITINDLTPFIPFQEDLIFTIEAKYTYNPDVGTISIITSPDNAEVFLNGKPMGSTDLMLPFTKVGVYSVRFEKPGYLDLEKKIEVTKNNTTAIIETLRSGYYTSITSTPSGTSVFLEGDEKGLTPVNIVLNNGLNNVVLKSPFYNDLVTTITPDRQNESFDFTLEKRTYNISVTTYPKKTNYLLNGSSFSSGDTTQVLGGAQQITLTKPNYKETTFPIQVKNTNEIQKFNMLLEPAVYRKKGAALLFSLIMPGMGQMYLKRSGIEPIMGVLGYGLIVGGIMKNNNAVKNYDLYIDYTEDEGGRDRLKSRWQKEKQQSNYMLYGAAAVWATNIVWTLLSKNEKARYDKLKTKIKFDNVTKSGGISLNYSITTKTKRGK